MVFSRIGKTHRQTGAWKPLLHHMLDVAAVLAVGLERRPKLLDFLAGRLALRADETRAMLLTLAALHDAGKAATAFQVMADGEVAASLGLKCDQTAPYTVRAHTDLGWVMLLTLVAEGRLKLPERTPLPAKALARLLFGIACGHHGTPPRGDWKRRLARAQNALFLSGDLDSLGWHVEAIDALFGWRGGLPDEKGLDQVSFLLNGLLTLCDWIGSTDHFPFADADLDAPRYWDEVALPAARRALDAFHPAPFSQPTPCPPAPFATLFPGIAHPTPLQAAVDALFTAERLPPGPLLVVIEDLTGSGKTEAGDLIAQRLVGLGRADGVYVGLPTMATADGAFARRFGDQEGRVPLDAALFAGPAQVMLAHSQRHRGRAFQTAPTFAGVERGEAHAVEWLARSARLALAADLGVGTVDQALAGAVSGRFATLRLAGLWRKLLLIDEVHAYDDYMRVLLTGLLRHHAMMGDPVVLMSATLPSGVRAALMRAYAEGAGWTAPAEVEREAYPLLTLLHEGGVEAHALAPAPGPGRRPVRFEALSTEDEIERRILAWLAAGRSVVWFRNTVGAAVATWRRLHAAAKAADLPEPLLYHARFVPRDRAAAEKRVLAVAGKQSSPKDRRGRLVISTQAAEQSLDLDFDEAVSDMAPGDVLFQRLGRRRRHPRSAAGQLLAEGTQDQRPDSTVILHVPPLDPTDKNWHGGLSAGAKRIYADPGVLWHTAKALLERPFIVPADDVRRIIETVYGSPAPAVLEPAAERARGDALAETQQGRAVAVDFSKNYVEGWRDEVGDGEPETPKTRLGESFSVVIAVLRESGAAFLVEDEDPIAASECRTPLRLEAAAGQSADQERLMARLSETVRAQAGAKPYVFLTPGDDGVCRGEAHSIYGDISLTYSETEGLCLGGW